MSDDSAHVACVDAWLERVVHVQSCEHQLELLDRALDALWSRAHRTLGDVTLTAIGERVLHRAAEHHPVLQALKVDETGIHGLRDVVCAQPCDRDETASAVRFVMIEFLTVLGRLTAEILSPALHMELTTFTSEHGMAVDGSECREDRPICQRSGGEEAK